MAWGYERSFTIEHDDTLRKRVNCKDCIYYEKSDKSCLKRPLYMPVDGYSSWKNCQFFQLSSSASNYDQKAVQVNKKAAKERNVQTSVTKKGVTKKRNTKKSTSVTMPSNFQDNQDICMKANGKGIRKLLLTSGYRLLLVDEKPQDLEWKHTLIYVLVSNGEIIRKVNVGYNIENRTMYVNKRAYSSEAIQGLVKMMKR